jgi:DNA replication protein DnaC
LSIQKWQLCEAPRQFKAAQLPVLDDLFLRKFPTGAGDDLADVIMSRYEQASTVITSNRSGGLGEAAR